MDAILVNNIPTVAEDAPGNMKILALPAGESGEPRPIGVVPRSKVSLLSAVSDDTIQGTGRDTDPLYVDLVSDVDGLWENPAPAHDIHVGPIDTISESYTLSKPEISGEVEGTWYTLYDSNYTGRDIEFPASIERDGDYAVVAKWPAGTTQNMEVSEPSYFEVRVFRDAVMDISMHNYMVGSVTTNPISAYSKIESYEIAVYSDFRESVMYGMTYPVTVSAQEFISSYGFQTDGDYYVRAVSHTPTGVVHRTAVHKVAVSGIEGKDCLRVTRSSTMYTMDIELLISGKAPDGFKLEFSASADFDTLLDISYKRSTHDETTGYTKYTATVNQEGVYYVRATIANDSGLLRYSNPASVEFSYVEDKSLISIQQTSTPTTILVSFLNSNIKSARVEYRCGAESYSWDVSKGKNSPYTLTFTNDGEYVMRAYTTLIDGSTVYSASVTYTLDAVGGVDAVRLTYTKPSVDESGSTIPDSISYSVLTEYNKYSFYVGTTPDFEYAQVLPSRSKSYSPSKDGIYYFWYAGKDQTGTMVHSNAAQFAVTYLSENADSVSMHVGNVKRKTSFKDMHAVDVYPVVGGINIASIRVLEYTVPENTEMDGVTFKTYRDTTDDSPVHVGIKSADAQGNTVLDRIADVTLDILQGSQLPDPMVTRDVYECTITDYGSKYISDAHIDSFELTYGEERALVDEYIAAGKFNLPTEGQYYINGKTTLMTGVNSRSAYMPIGVDIVKGTKPSMELGADGRTVTWTMPEHSKVSGIRITHGGSTRTITYSLTATGTFDAPSDGIYAVTAYAVGYKNDQILSDSESIDVRTMRDSEISITAKTGGMLEWSIPAECRPDGYIVICAEGTPDNSGGAVVGDTMEAVLGPDVTSYQAKHAGKYYLCMYQGSNYESPTAYAFSATVDVTMDVQDFEGYISRYTITNFRAVTEIDVDEYRVVANSLDAGIYDVTYQADDAGYMVNASGERSVELPMDGYYLIYAVSKGIVSGTSKTYDVSVMNDAALVLAHAQGDGYNTTLSTVAKFDRLKATVNLWFLNGAAWEKAPEAYWTSEPSSGNGYLLNVYYAGTYRVSITAYKVDGTEVTMGTSQCQDYARSFRQADFLFDSNTYTDMVSLTVGANEYAIETLLQNCGVRVSYSRTDGYADTSMSDKSENGIYKVYTGGRSEAGGHYSLQVTYRTIDTAIYGGSEITLANYTFGSKFAEYTAALGDDLYVSMRFINLGVVDDTGERVFADLLKSSNAVQLATGESSMSDRRLLLVAGTDNTYSAKLDSLSVEYSDILVHYNGDMEERGIDAITMPTISEIDMADSGSVYADFQVSDWMSGDVTVEFTSKVHTTGSVYSEYLDGFIISGEQYSLDSGKFIVKLSDVPGWDSSKFNCIFEATPTLSGKATKDAVRIYAYRSDLASSITFTYEQFGEPGSITGDCLRLGGTAASLCTHVGLGSTVAKVTDGVINDIMGTKLLSAGIVDNLIVYIDDAYRIAGYTTMTVSQISGAKLSVTGVTKEGITVEFAYSDTVEWGTTQNCLYATTNGSSYNALQNSTLTAPGEYTYPLPLTPGRYNVAVKMLDTCTGTYSEPSDVYEAYIYDTVDTILHEFSVTGHVLNMNIVPSYEASINSITVSYGDGRSNNVPYSVGTHEYSAILTPGAPGVYKYSVSVSVDGEDITLAEDVSYQIGNPVQAVTFDRDVMKWATDSDYPETVEQVYLDYGIKEGEAEGRVSAGYDAKEITVPVSSLGTYGAKVYAYVNRVEILCYEGDYTIDMDTGNTIQFSHTMDENLTMDMMVTPMAETSVKTITVSSVPSVADSTVRTHVITYVPNQHEYTLGMMDIPGEYSYSIKVDTYDSHSYLMAEGTYTIANPVAVEAAVNVLSWTVVEDYSPAPSGINIYADGVLVNETPIEYAAGSYTLPGNPGNGYVYKLVAIIGGVEIECGAGTYEVYDTAESISASSVAFGYNVACSYYGQYVGFPLVEVSVEPANENSITSLVMTCGDNETVIPYVTDTHVYVGALDVGGPSDIPYAYIVYAVISDTRIELCSGTITVVTPISQATVDDGVLTWAYDSWYAESGLLDAVRVNRDGESTEFGISTTSISVSGEWTIDVKVNGVWLTDCGPANVVRILGDEYRYVKIGDQYWLAQNLKYTEDDLDYIENDTYGIYYSTDALVRVNELLADSGWHIATEHDFYELGCTVNGGEPGEDDRYNAEDHCFAFPELPISKLWSVASGGTDEYGLALDKCGEYEGGVEYGVGIGDTLVMYCNESAAQGHGSYTSKIWAGFSSSPYSLSYTDDYYNYTTIRLVKDS